MLHTKIIATIGPSSDSKKVIESLIRAGAVCFRFNFKHSSLDWHKQRLDRVRQVSKKLGMPVALFIDLQGPEVRIGDLKNDSLSLQQGEKLVLAEKNLAGKKTIPIPDEKVLQKLKPGNTIYLDDAFIELKVVGKEKNYFLVEVIEGGILKSRKGANFPSLDLELDTLVEKDIKALSLAQKEELDFIGLSFVRNEQDIINLKTELKKRKIGAKVIAKIETAQAVQNFDKILNQADAVMVARGDLAVEFAFEKVPAIQKQIIKKCRNASVPVVVATQMLQSMVDNPRPTRAEISDVANAVYDKADCLMLSGESAAGKYPVKALKTMAKIAGFVEKDIEADKLNIATDDISEVITQSAYWVSQSEFAKENQIKKIIVLTETGRTAKLLSRYRPKLDIIAISSRKKTVESLSLSFGIKPYFLKYSHGKKHSVKKVMSFLKQKRQLKKGEDVIFIHGEKWGTPAGTNTLRIQHIS